MTVERLPCDTAGRPKFGSLKSTEWPRNVTTRLPKRYEGEGIVIGWEPTLDIQVANCIRSLPHVSEPSAPADGAWRCAAAATSAYKPCCDLSHLAMGFTG